MTDPLQPGPILQSDLRDPPWAGPATMRLPGTGPIAPGDWLRIDDAYAPQMALRDRLIAERREAVHALLPDAAAPARELLDQVLEWLDGRADFRTGTDRVIRPDGVTVPLDREAPLLTLGRLLPQDFCILQRESEEHVLTGAILCFPASWTLDEKIGRPLTAIHAPVAPYDEDIARRVQRLFDSVRPERPLWRVNLLRYEDPALFQPRRVADRRQSPGGAAQFIRSERQCISRLPATGAMVFAIHTVVVRRDALSAARQAELQHYLATQSEA